MFCSCRLQHKSLPPILCAALSLTAAGCTHISSGAVQEQTTQEKAAGEAEGDASPQSAASPEGAGSPENGAATSDGQNSSESGESASQPSSRAASRRAHLARMTARMAAEIPDEPDDDAHNLGDGHAEDEDDVLDDLDASEAHASCQQTVGPDGILTAVRPGVRYTADITDEELARLWKESPEELGSISIGIPSVGRIVNASPFPKNDAAWTIVAPGRTYGTEETIAYVTTAIAEVIRQYPEGTPLRINDIGMPNGGYLQPHQSHQAGRDVDLGFYYGDNGPDRGPWAVQHNFDLDRNWALIRAFITETDVQVILTDSSIIKRLYDHAVKKGEDKAWLESVFHAGTRSLLRHARGHRDHFHVRFYNPRAQELGRRILPMVPKDPRQNLRYHRVVQGDTLGKLAFTFGSTIKAIQEANNLKGTMIRIGQTLAIPLRGPCVNCPMPPEVIVPPRRLPPQPPAPLLASIPELPAPAGEAASPELELFLAPWTAWSQIGAAL